MIKDFRLLSLKRSSRMRTSGSFKMKSKDLILSSRDKIERLKREK
jgi:hypothetical protein